MPRTSFFGFGFQRPMRRAAILATLCSVGVAGGACTVNSTSSSAEGGPGTPEGGGEPDATSSGDASPDTGPLGTSEASSGDAGAAPSFAFVPSNISLAGIDLSGVADEDLASECGLDTGTGPTAGGSCFKSAVETVLTQSDQSKVHVFIVKSLKIEPTAHLFVNAPAGGLPLVIVTLGDMTILGTVDAHGVGEQALGGGFQASQNSQKGAGPGGGPAVTGVVLTTPGAGGGGGSYCGKGAQGALEPMATGAAGAATAPYGTAEIVPLVGGSSGGTGSSIGAGAGGGALQLVAGGQFSMGASSYVNVGGGGGHPGYSANYGDDGNGGGSGGSILIEATSVQIAGILAANGGGGGGVGGNGHDGTPDSIVAAGGAMTGGGAGGAGGAATAIDGTTPASVDAGPVGGGGGGVGRIRINTMSGSAVITSATLSPAVTTTCVTQGKVTPNAK